MRLLCAILNMMAFVLPVSADEVREKRISFVPGKNYSADKGWLSGSETARYLLAAKAGQNLLVKFSPMGESCALKILSPPDGKEIHASTATNEPFNEALRVTGDYAIVVFNQSDGNQAEAKCTYAVRFQLK
jgi:hypothetical protein